VDAAALNGTWPDQADLGRQFLEVSRTQAGQHLHLAAALNLEDADGIGGGNHGVDGRVGQVEIGAACRPNEAQAAADERQHP
jgi:hypothetical protein